MAAQWHPNGAALGTTDLTAPGAQVFGSNVFSPIVQRQRLPKAVYKQLQAALETGGALDAELADSVATAMKEWAMERGATHYTHWFQPLTGLTAEKHDSFYGPTVVNTRVDSVSPSSASARIAARESASIERSSGILWSSASPVHDANAVGMQSSVPLGFSSRKAGDVGSHAV